MQSRLNIKEKKMKINAINNFMTVKPLQKFAFKGEVQNPITPISKVNLNQPKADVFETKTEKVI